MKKIIALVLALTLVFALGATAYAASVVEVKTTVPESYTLSIPSGPITLAFDDDTDQVFGEIGLNTVRIISGNHVKISVTGDTLTRTGGSETIPFMIKDSGTVFTSASFTNKTDRTALSILVKKEDWDNAAAGNYSGTVTFSAVIESIT